MRYILFFLLILISYNEIHAQCKIDSTDNYSIDKNGQAKSAYRFIYNYSSSPTQNVLEIFERDTLSGSLKPYSKEISELNSKNQVISIIQQRYDATKKLYINANKTVYTYNAIGKVETEIYMLKVNSTQFQANQRFVYAYDANKNMVYTEVDLYDNGIYHLDEERFFLYDFDINNNLIKKLEYIDGGPLKGTVNSRTSYIYNSFGMLERKIYEQNNNRGKFDETQFEYKSWDNYNYDSIGRISMIQELYDTINVTSVSKYAYTNNGYILTNRNQEYFTRYYYSCILTKSDDQNRLAVEIYPNPVNDEISINYAPSKVSNIHYEISSLTGNIVLKGSIDHSNLISLRQLNQGIYILKLMSGNILRTFKFIKS